ncbi:hypothetical protein TWF694_009797 [Orbilia ellipsospora]|uniref:Uncharacterized protein n=1 Tax=Orbilia ellipsospora TaxID=2528407 RepID=A0AAV9XBX4_9PEZI
MLEQCQYPSRLPRNLLITVNGRFFDRAAEFSFGDGWPIFSVASIPAPGELCTTGDWHAWAKDPTIHELPYPGKIYEGKHIALVKQIEYNCTFNCPEPF